MIPFGLFLGVFVCRGGAETSSRHHLLRLPFFIVSDARTRTLEAALPLICTTHTEMSHKSRMRIERACLVTGSCCKYNETMWGHDRKESIQ